MSNRYPAVLTVNLSRVASECVAPAPAQKERTESRRNDLQQWITAECASVLVGLFVALKAFQSSQKRVASNLFGATLFLNAFLCEHFMLDCLPPDI